MTSTLRVVPMVTTHIAALMPYEHEMFGNDAWTVDAYQAELDDTELRHYLAVESVDGELLGWGGIMSIGETAQLFTIGVVPHAQRQGVARTLLYALFAIARDHGAQECILEVRVDNEPARAFYDAEGFMRLRLRRGYYDNGRSDALEMRLDLRRARDVWSVQS